MTIRLLKITLEGFRGFAQEQTIDLDADAVVIQGDNGTGKTSLVDGLLWLFSGQLNHLGERVRGIRQTEDILASRFNPSGATVELTISRQHEIYAARRSGNQRSNVLTVEVPDGSVLQGHDAEARLAQVFGIESLPALAQNVSTWGVLRQDAIRSALDETGGALHERVSALVGLERVSAFAAAASRASKGLVRERTEARRIRDSSRQRAQTAATRHDDAARRAASAEELQKLVSARIINLRALGSGTVGLSVSNHPDLNEIAEIGKDAATVLDQLAAFDRWVVDLAEFPPNPDELVRQAEVAAARAEQAAAEATERAPTLVQLATAALDLVDEHCPVCAQPVDQELVRNNLRQVLKQAATQAAQAQTAQDQLAQARRGLASARAVVSAKAAAVEELSKASMQLAAFLESPARSIRLVERPHDSRSVGIVVRDLTALQQGLRELYREVRQASGAEIANLSDLVAESRSALETAEVNLQALERRCDQAKELESAANAAAEEILEAALQALAPSFAEVFDRLSPNPAFTQLRSRQDVMRNRNQVIPMVRDPERDIEANPLLVFSEGQLNIVALSYFLGMALNARDAALPFLVLDDPLQALDVVGILGFSDLCRQIRSRRQLLITTHDRRFADVLVRKLSPRDGAQSLIVHRFEGWNRDGPQIETETIEQQPVLFLLPSLAS